MANSAVPDNFLFSRFLCSHMCPVSAMNRILPPLIHATALCVSMWFCAQAYLEGKRVTENAQTDRVKFQAVIAEFEKEKTQALVSLYAGNKPIEKMGCPMEAVEGPVKKNGKNKVKRVC